MIYIRMELWPGGDRDRARLLGEATIANIGGDTRTGDYDVRLLKWVLGKEPGKAPLWKRGKVEGFPRLRLGPWDLLYRALAAIVAGSRNRGVPLPGEEAIGEPTGPVDS